MKHGTTVAVVWAALAAAAAVAGAGQAVAYDGWHQDSAVVLNSKTAAFDYITFDDAKNRLFIGHRKEGLQVYDIASKSMVKLVDKTLEHSSNGAVLMPDFDLGISNNEDGTITPFKLSTLEASEPIKLGEELDTSHYDPATKRIFINMAAGKDGTDVIVLDAATLKQVGLVKLGTKKAEHADFDGKGSMFMAGRDTDKIYKIDTKAMTLVSEWPTAGCAQTNSVAMDVANDRLLVACRGSDKVKPSFVVMNAKTGAVTFTAEIGGGNDGLVYDAATKRVFMANGLAALLNVFEQVDADNYKPVEALGTRPMAKVLAMDHKNNRIYSMTAETSADFGKKINVAVGPFYPNTFLPNTFTILTYAPAK
jgi:DNA-binding beta-propeller fold protein YncE